MQSGKVACITRELEDLLMIEEERGTLQKKNGSVADLLAEMETAVAQVEAQREKAAGQPEETRTEIPEKPTAPEPVRKTAETPEPEQKMPKPDRKPEPEPVRKLEAEPSKTLSSPKEKSHRATRQEKRAKKRLRRQEREDEGLLHSADALIAAFAIPVIIMLIIFVQRGIFPFGEETFLRTDMYHQYAPFFSEFQYKLTHGGSLLYSWDVGMGVNFSALYAYYLASPVNWLLFLCPKGLVIEFMTYQIVIKIGLCGLTMAYYLRKHCRTNDFGVAFFGIFYALSGYGGLQLEYHVAGLHHPVSAHCSGPGAAGQRWKRNALLPDTGAVHSFQLLYLHHDLHIYGAVFHCPAGAG